MSRLLMLPLAALFLSCGGDEPDLTEQSTLDAPPEGHGFQLELYATAEPYSEIWECDVYDVPTTEIAYVNWLEFNQNAGTHHMTLSTPNLGTTLDIDNGTYDCNDIYRDTMDAWTMIYGDQGTATGDMHLPDGVAASLPADLKILHEVHYVNATDEPVELYSQVNAWTMLESEVAEGLWGGSVRDENIFIPA